MKRILRWIIFIPSIPVLWFLAWLFEDKGYMDDLYKALNKDWRE